MEMGEKVKTAVLVVLIGLVAASSAAVLAFHRKSVERGASLRTAAEKVESLGKEKERWSAEREALLEKVRESESAYEALREAAERIAALEEEREAGEREAAAARENAARLEEELRVAEARLEVRQERLAALRLDLQRNLLRVKALEGTVEQCRTRLEGASRDAARLREEKKRAEEAGSRLRWARGRENLQALAVVEKLQGALSEERAKVSELREELEELEALRQALKKCRSRETPVSKRDKGKEKIVFRVLPFSPGEARAAEEPSLEEAEKSRDIRQQLMSHLIVSQKKVLELQEALEKSRERAATLSESLETARRESLEVRKDLESRLERRSSELEEARQRASALEKSLDAARRESVEAREQWEKQLDEKTSELGEARERTATLNESLETARRESLEVRKELEGKLERESAELKEALASVSELRTTLKARGEEVARLEKDSGALKSALRSGSERMEGLEKELADLREVRKETERRLGELKSTCNTLLGQLKSRVKDQRVTIRKLEEELTVSFVDSILFDSGKASINGTGRETLGQVSEVLKTLRDREIRVVGHADNVPISSAWRRRYPSNWELSAHRAAAVVRCLQENGLDPARMEVVGRSCYRPVALNDTREGRARNRRVEIIVAPEPRPPRNLSEQ